jgi:type IV secretion system protein VirB3
VTLAAKQIPRVLSRHHLLIGGEREPVLISALICGGVAISSMTIVAFVVCGTLWFTSLMVWRWMAKADPQMSRVYQRNLRYRGFYPAFSRPYRKQ